MSAAKHKMKSLQILEKIRSKPLAIKSQRALANIISACDVLDKDHIAICPSKVASICGKAGPKAQSISNNKSFSAYVNARRLEQGVLSSDIAGGNSKIRSGDPNIDAEIMLLEFQLAQAKAELKSLKSLISSAGPFELKAALESGALALAKPAIDRVSPEVKEAIRNLLSPATLDAVGLVLTKTGQIIAPGANSASLMSKRQVDALQKLL